MNCQLGRLPGRCGKDRSSALQDLHILAEPAVLLAQLGQLPPVYAGQPAVAAHSGLTPALVADAWTAALVTSTYFATWPVDRLPRGHSAEGSAWNFPVDETSRAFLLPLPEPHSFNDNAA